jgi:O-antigen biosynthesis protein
MTDKSQQEPDIERVIEEARSEIKALQDQLDIAHRSMERLVKQLSELENSRLVKFRKYYYHYANKLKSSFKKGEKRSYFSIFKNYILKRGFYVLRLIFSKVFKALYLLVETRNVIIVDVTGQFKATSSEYSAYLMEKKVTKNVADRMIKQIAQFKKRPLFSVLIPIYNAPVDFLREALDSVIAQVYTDWELCIADDCSTDPEVIQTLKEYEDKYDNIHVTIRTENGHISKATNTALEMAKGEYVVFMDQDDVIREDALYYMALAINKNEKADLIYSDEDKIDEWNIHSEYHFKPDWSPDNLLSRNYLGHICVFKTDQVRSIGGLREGYEGSQDYDLALRYTEKFDAVIHVPEVLYHWRIHGESAAAGEYVKPYAYQAAQRSITEALIRKGWSPKVDFLDGFRGYSVRLDIKDPGKLVSIIIPTKNKEDYLERCLKSIDEKSTYRHFEIVLIDNNSDSPAFFKLVEKWKKQTAFSFKYVKEESEFNFSHLMNVGRKNASGEYLMLLNNDTEIITPDWMEGLIEHVQRKEIGIAGCKLLYDDESIQHAGVVVGLGGAAGHILVGEDRYGPGYFNYINMLNNFSALTAAAFMVRTAVFDEVGGFDERLKIEFNDVDFCLKVREAGYHNLYVPHVELYHYESITRGHPHSNTDSYKLHIKEIGRFVKRWKNYVDKDPCYNVNLSLGVHNFGLKT